LVIAKLSAGEHGIRELNAAAENPLIDVAGRTVRRQLFTKGSWSKYMALSPDEKTLFVSNWVSDDVSRIDLATGDVQLIKTVDTPRGL